MLGVVITRILDKNDQFIISIKIYAKKKGKLN